jgi:hypothetical protein
MKPIDNLRARMGHDIGDVCDRIWAGISGSRASTEPASGLRPTGFDPGRNSVSSQEKEAGAQ